MSMLGSPHTPKPSSEAKLRRAVSGHGESVVALDSVEIQPMLFSPDSMSNAGSSSSRFTSPIKVGTVMSMIAKLAKPVEEGRDLLYSPMYPNNLNNAHSIVRQYVRILGPFANPEMVWMGEDEMRKDIMEYDSKQDPQLLMLEAQILDAQTALNGQLAEFHEYGTQYKSLSVSSVHVTRSLAKVIGQLTKQTNDINKSLGREAACILNLEDLSGIYDEDSVPVQWQEEDLASGIDEKEFPDVHLFLKWHAAFSKSITSIFSVDYVQDLKRQESIWRGKYKSLEHELCRSEAHFIGQQRAQNRKRTIEAMLKRNTKPELQQTLQSEVQNLDRIIHASTILYKGILNDLKHELVNNQFLHDDVSSLLKVTSEKETQLFESGRSFGGDHHQQKLNDAALFTSPEDFFAKKSPKMSRSKDVSASNTLEDSLSAQPDLPKPKSPEMVVKREVVVDVKSPQASPAPVVSKDAAKAGLQAMLMQRLAPPAVMTSPRAMANNSLYVLQPDTDSSIPAVPTSIQAMYGLAGADVLVQSRAEREGLEVTKMGITPIPQVNDIQFPVTSRGIETGALKLWHWSPVTLQHLQQSIWSDIARYLDPLVLQVEYHALFIDVLEDIKPVEDIRTSYDSCFGLLCEQDIVDQVLLFSQKKNIKAAVTTVNQAGGGKMKQSILESKRSHAISISLGRIKMDYNELLHAVYSGSQLITADLALVLLTLIPTHEEIKLLESHRDTVSIESVGEAEAFCFALINVEKELRTLFHSTSHQEMTIFERCIRCCIFTHEFGTMVRGIEDQQATVKNAQHGLTSSNYSKIILLMQLSVGNVLNCFHTTSSSRYGFHLSDLSGLSGIKADGALVEATSNRLYYKLSEEEEDEMDMLDPNIADQLELLDVDCIDLPQPKNANLLHFLVKLLYRHDEDLCNTFERAGAAYTAAGRIEQASLIQSIHVLSMQHLVLEHFTTQINVELQHSVIHQHGGLVVDQVLQRAMITNSDTPIHIVCTAGLFDTYTRLSEFVEYSTLRIQSVVGSLQELKNMAVETSEAFDFPEARKSWELVFIEWGLFMKQLGTAHQDLLLERQRVVSMVKRKQSAQALQKSKTGKGALAAVAAASDTAAPQVYAEEEEDIQEQSIADLDILEFNK